MMMMNELEQAAQVIPLLSFGALLLAAVLSAGAVIAAKWITRDSTQYSDTASAVWAGQLIVGMALLALAARKGMQMYPMPESELLLPGQATVHMLCLLAALVALVCFVGSVMVCSIALALSAVMFTARLTRRPHASSHLHSWQTERQTLAIRSESERARV